MGAYASDPLGLYQVHGNIYEWTQDCFNKRYTEGAPVNGAPWLEGDCTQRMVRAGRIGGWSANKIRAGARDEARADSGAGPYGLCVVRDLSAIR